MVFNIDDIWTADLDTSKQSLSKENNGYKYLLNVIDIFSKYAFSVPLKSKHSEAIIEAFDKLFHFRMPKKLWTDRGTEFVNNKFKDFLKSHKIE
jgi:transposase InsO family protein